MITIVALSLALAVGTVTASPLPQDAPIGPAPTGSPTCSQTITSVAGDTCATIGAKYGFTADEIHAANTFLNCDDIWAWTPVCIPQHASTCVSTYVSEPNDSCQSIESKFGLPAGAIQAANNFLNCNDIWQYTPICIPGGGISSSLTVPTTSTTATTTSSGSAGTPCASVYTAQAGDTCASIVKGSRSVGREIYLANPTLDCNNIWAGTPVCINQNAYSYIQTATPTPILTCAKTYTSVAGDTCQSISRSQSTDLAAADIASANSFVNCDDIWAGTSICIPEYTSVPYCKHIIHAYAGESCYNLSRPYKIGPSDIMAVTPGLDCGSDQFGNSNAYEGQEICIPWSTFY